MSGFDRSDFAALTDAKKHKRMEGQIPALRALMAVAPKMEQLTHDERWDTYCSYLAGIKEKLQAAKLGAQNRLNSPAVVNNDEMMAQKITLLVNEAQIQMIDLALDLPKAMMDGADGAKELLAKWDTEKAA